MFEFVNLSDEFNFSAVILLLWKVLFGRFDLIGLVSYVMFVRFNLVGWVLYIMFCTLCLVYLDL